MPGIFINSHFGSVRVYTLVDPKVLADNAIPIARELFDLRDLNEGNRVFSIHPGSGYLFYADYNELWANKKGGKLPSDRRTVEKAARGFIEDANKKISGSRALRQEGIPQLFPSDLRVVWIGEVASNSSSTGDHWLCQFGVYLAADSNRTARVEGAAIDVRLGGDGKIIGLSSTWRPMSGDRLSTEPADPSELDPIYADAEGAIRAPRVPTVPVIDKPKVPFSPLEDPEETTPPEFLFWLADEAAPQKFLAPILLRHDGHEGEVTAASRHSLCAEIWERTTGTQVEVLAVVTGGSGNYEYQWGSWSTDSIFSEGVKTLETSPTVSLDPGVHNIILQVKDKLTEAVVQTEKVVFFDGRQD